MKSQSFCQKFDFKVNKQVQKYIGSVIYYRNYIPEKLIGMYKLLKTYAIISISEESLENFKAINASLAEACGLAPPRPGHKFLCIAIRIDDTRKQRTENIVKAEDIRPSSIWITYLLTLPTEFVNILQKLPFKMSRFPWKQPYSIANYHTNPSKDTQEIFNEIVSNKNHTHLLCETPATASCSSNFTFMPVAGSQLQQRNFGPEWN